MKRKFWLVTYRDENGEVEFQRLDADTSKYADDVDCTVEPCDEPSGKLLAQWMDSNAENWNYHSLVGVHEYLYECIATMVGTEEADLVFRELADKEKFLGQKGGY